MPMLTRLLQILHIIPAPMGTAVHHVASDGIQRRFDPLEDSLVAAYHHGEGASRSPVDSATYRSVQDSHAFLLAHPVDILNRCGRVG